MLRGLGLCRATGVGIMLANLVGKCFNYLATSDHVKADCTHLSKCFNYMDRGH